MGTKSQGEPRDRQVLFPVLQNGMIGYMNRSGKMTVQPQFAGLSQSFRVIGAIAVRGFREGLAPVEVGGKWGYIDRDGKMAIDPQFDEAGAFQDRLAPVKLSDKW